jgi:hypothetical protein
MALSRNEWRNLFLQTDPDSRAQLRILLDTVNPPYDRDGQSCVILAALQGAFQLVRDLCRDGKDPRDLFFREPETGQLVRTKRHLFEFLPVEEFQKLFRDPGVTAALQRIEHFGFWIADGLEVLIRDDRAENINQLLVFHHREISNFIYEGFDRSAHLGNRKWMQYFFEMYRRWNIGMHPILASAFMVENAAAVTFLHEKVSLQIDNSFPPVIPFPVSLVAVEKYLELGYSLGSGMVQRILQSICRDTNHINAKTLTVAFFALQNHRLGNIRLINQNIDSAIAKIYVAAPAKSFTRKDISFLIESMQEPDIMFEHLLGAAELETTPRRADVLIELEIFPKDLVHSKAQGLKIRRPSNETTGPFEVAQKQLMDRILRQEAWFRRRDLLMLRYNPKDPHPEGGFYPRGPE